MNTRPLHTRSDRRQPERLSRWRVAFPLLGTVIILLLLSTLARAQAVTDPGTSGPCTTSSQVVKVNGTLTTTIYYPMTVQALDSFSGEVLAFTKRACISR